MCCFCFAADSAAEKNDFDTVNQPLDNDVAKANGSFVHLKFCECLQFKIVKKESEKMYQLPVNRTAVVGNDTTIEMLTVYPVPDTTFTIGAPFFLLLIGSIYFTAKRNFLYVVTCSLVVYFF